MFGRKRKPPPPAPVDVPVFYRYGITRLSTGYEYIAVKVPTAGGDEMPATTLERGIKATREEAVNATRAAIERDRMATDARSRTEWTDVR